MKTAIQIISILSYLCILLAGQIIGIPFFFWLIFTAFDFGNIDQLFAILGIVGVGINLSKWKNSIPFTILSFFFMISPILSRLLQVSIESFDYLAFKIPLSIFVFAYLLFLILNIFDRKKTVMNTAEKSITNCNLRVESIKMKAPTTADDGSIIRVSYITNQKQEWLLGHENYLRRWAYKNTTIHTDDSYFDDSDMTSDYYLVVVYDQSSNTPLLSSRHYFNKSIIQKYLNGDQGNDFERTPLGESFQLDKYNKGEIFLADRLSGNLENAIYMGLRKQIFSAYYEEIVSKNKNATLLLMVRKENDDQQLSKYLFLGFDIIGNVIHKGKIHTIIIRDLKTV